MSEMSDWLFPLVDGEEEEDLLDALQLVLPLAKGYVSTHQVGSNQKYIEDAEKIIADWRKNDQT